MGTAFVIGELDASAAFYRPPEPRLFPTPALKANYLEGYKATVKARVVARVLAYRPYLDRTKRPTALASL